MSNYFVGEGAHTQCLFSSGQRIFMPPLPSAAAFADLMVRDMLPLTAEHISSMLQDRRHGKPTEIDFLNGAVVRVAEQFGVLCVANKVIYHLVKMMEKSTVPIVIRDN